MVLKVWPLWCCRSISIICQVVRNIVSEHPRSSESQRMEWSDARKIGELTEPFLPSFSQLKKEKKVLCSFLLVMVMLTVSESCAKYFTSSQHALSLYSRYIVTGYCSREPDQCSLLLYAHSLKQVKIMSLILTDACLCWATLRLQRAVFSLR